MELSQKSAELEPQQAKKRTGSSIRAVTQGARKKNSERESNLWEIHEQGEDGIGNANEIAIGLNVLEASQDLKRRKFLKQV